MFISCNRWTCFRSTHRFWFFRLPWQQSIKYSGEAPVCMYTASHPKEKKYCISAFGVFHNQKEREGYEGKTVSQQRCVHLSVTTSSSFKQKPQILGLVFNKIKGLQFQIHRQTHTQGFAQKSCFVPMKTFGPDMVYARSGPHYVTKMCMCTHTHTHKTQKW